MRNQFELRNFDRGDFVEAAAKKAEAVINTAQIKLESFVDMYGPERIAKDTAYLNRVMQEIASNSPAVERESQKFSKVLEAIVHDAGGKHEWFGKGATLIKTSPLDDIANGVDEVVEFRKEEKPTARSFLALGIDVTYNPFIDRKFRRIKDGIERGELATVKYFVDPKNEIRGELNKIPQVIVGVDGHTVKQLAQLWLEGERMPLSRDELAKHAVQMQILEEIEMQSEAFSRFAKGIGREEVAQKYAETRELVRIVLAERKGKVFDQGRRDDVYYAIQAGLRDFRG